MVSVCLPSDALLQHLWSYLGFFYLGRGVSPLGPPAPAQPPLLGRGVAPPSRPPDLGHGVAPLPNFLLGLE